MAYINTSSHFKVNLYRFYYAKQDSLNRKINNKFYSLLVPVNYINPKTLNYKIHNPAAWVINQITKDFTNFSDVSRDNVLRTFNLLAETKSLVLFTIDNGVLSVNKKNNLNEACENAVILYSRIFEYLAQNGYINNVSFLIRFSDFFDDDTSYNSTSLAPILTTSTDEHLQRILNKHVILIPDFMSLEDIPKLIPKIKKASQIYRWDKKQNKVYWRGGYADVSGLRKSIVEYSTKHPDSIIDAKFVETKKDFIAPEFQLQSKFLLNIDGYGPSWTRPIWQLYSNSVMLKQNSELIQWYYAALVPDVHFIVVDNDPVEIIKKINSYPDEVLYKIALAGSDFAANNLTINDMVAYIALVVQKYENLQNNLIQF